MAITWGCGDPSSQSIPYRQFDSAGVTAAVSTAAEWAPGTEWRLATDPDVVIGSAEGDDRYLFGDVLMASRFSDGRIAVLDVGVTLVRVYDPRGRHLFDVGGRGEGPSEFSFPQHLLLRADSIVVYDAVTRRTTWFSPDGEFVRADPPPARPDGGEFYGRAVGSLSDGTLLIATTSGSSATAPEHSVRETQIVWADPPYGTTARTLFEVLGREQELFTSDGRPARRDLLFGQTAVIAAGGDRIVHGSTETYSLKVLDRTGVFQRIVRRPEPAVPVTPAAVRRYVGHAADRAGLDEETRGAMLRSVLQRSRADSMPHFRSVFVDADDNLWVEGWTDIGVETGPFSVFSPEGRWLGNVAVPSGLPELRGSLAQPLEIGSDYVLGTWTTELGVPQVRLYRLIKD